MVYCGKPSKGCHMCRKRKIRCDQGRPACDQCIRTKRECPGYRDQLDLIFRDDPPRNAYPERHVRSPSTTGSTGSNAETSFDFNSDPGHQYIMRQIRPSAVITNPTEGLSKEQAICFFLQSHSIPGSSLMTDTLTNFLMDSGGSLGQQAVQSSIYAVAGAMLSRVRNVPSLKQAARQEYGSTLKLVNAALADPVQSRTNQALLAVVFMSLYEVITSRAPQSIQGWTNHICGAAALLEHRGFAQMTTVMGVRLFLHLRYQIIRDALGNRLIIIIGNLSNLRADVQGKILDDPQQILAAASAIEADLMAWLAALPPDFTYSSHTVMPTDHSFEHICGGIRPLNNQYHSYPDLWSPNLWNHYRSARIIVSELILANVHKVSSTSPHGSLSEDFRLHCKSLRSTIRRLGADICRSVPFHLGACNAGILPGRPMLPSETYIGGLMLLWPLFVAGMVEGPNHPQRRWVRQCLGMIGRSMGMDQALALMDILTVDPGMFHSVEKFGENADEETSSPGVMSVSIFHVPYYELGNMKEYQEIRASSA
ncbi:hypothetical protein N7509_004192 [Penicillium cosmopolitanum]|uniref:Zn(2)-C6 fungal-type domain-containing protein n=1 Tax=Penicillium cosmopolitanum TaxID=1131564 RepID=A0A9X0BC37_9EURO|nr:uncharacterized protein N7509_004192 [Penicillium cosmopolitanum]KAJ5404321.1 hypothetical protein N7509_004192 [Penicillium cosmopolitanum]